MFDFLYTDVCIPPFRPKQPLYALYVPLFTYMTLKNMHDRYNSNKFIKNTAGCMLVLLQAPLAASANNNRCSNY